MADWFAPKRYGYGAGLPIAWQGWALSVGYVALLAIAALLIPYSWIAYGAFAAMWTATFILLIARNTKGGWRWRWGEKD